MWTDTIGKTRNTTLADGARNVNCLFFRMNEDEVVITNKSGAVTPSELLPLNAG